MADRRWRLWWGGAGLAAAVVAGLWLGLPRARGPDDGPAPARDRAAPAAPAPGGGAPLPPGEIRGCLAAWPDGTGVEGAAVVLARTGHVSRTLTGTGGFFSIADLPAGEDYRLTIARGSFAPVERPGLVVSPGHVTDVGTLLLSPPAALSVEVTDGGGRPRAGATVWLFASADPALGAPDPADLRAPLRTEEADDGGRAVFTGLAAGWLAVVASAPGHSAGVEACFALPGPEPRVVAVRLGAGFGLRGVVTLPDGRPASGRVLLDPGGGRRGGPLPRLDSPLDSGGGYRFEGLAAGSCRLLVEVSGRAPIPAGFVAVPEVEVRDIRLSPAATLSGTVTDAERRPVAGARVTEDRTGTATTTGEDGRFRFSGLSAGTATVGVRAEGFLPAWSPPTAIGPDFEADIIVCLARGVPLAGRVTAADTGEALPFALVTAIPVGGVLGHEIRAGPTGEYRFPALEPDRYGVRAQSGDYGSQSFPDVDVVAPLSAGAVPPGCLVSLPPGSAGGRCDLKLTKCAAIEGTVRDAEGRPVGGARVGVLRESWAFRSYPVPVLSRADGAFRIAGLSAGECRVGAAAGLVEGRSGVLEVAEGAPLRGVVIVLEPGGTVMGVIETTDGGSPAGGWVTSPKAFPLAEADVPAAPVAADGSFVLGGLPAGFLDLEVQIPGYPPASLENVRVPEGGVLPGVRIEVRPGLTFRGRVVRADGSPIGGAEILASDRGLVARTDAGGRFAVRGWTPGEAGFEARCEGYRTGRFRWRDPTESSPDEEQVLVLEAVREVGGRVLAEDGTPIAGVEVRVFRLGAGGGSAATGADGSFLVLDAPVGAVSMFVTGSPGERGGWQPLHLPEVAAAGAPLEVRLRPGLRIAGRVTGPDGASVAEASIGIRHCWPETFDGWGELTWSASTGPDGRYVLSGLPPGEFAISVYARGFVHQSVPGISAGREDVDVVLGPGRTVRGRVLSPTGEPAEKALVRLEVLTATYGSTWSAETDGEGRFSFERLPEGSISLSVSPRTGGAPTEIHGVAAGPDEVVVRLDEGLSVTGVLCREDGRPLPNVRVLVEGDYTRPERHGRSGEDGRFRIVGLPPGRHRLSLRPEEDGWRLREAAEAEAGGAEVRLTAVEAPSIAGVVLDRDGNPVRAWVYLTADMERDVYTGEDGKFLFLGVPDGDCGVHVLGPEGQSVTVRVRAGDRQIVIRLP